MNKKLVDLAETVRDHGGRAMLVGGCVRDELMNVAPKDFDVEVFGIEPAKLKAILHGFGRVDTVGESFTVYKLGRHLDVSLPRRERKVGRGHRGFVVEGDPQMSFEEAARRRDFTINAIMRDVLTGEIIDIFGGRNDIKLRRIRHIDDKTFVEDSLRVLRAAQFAARFEFEIDEETIRLCQSIDLTDLPKERIWGEFEKLLLKAEKPSIGLQYLYRLNVVNQLFPELAALVGVAQDAHWHPEGDVDVHTMLTIDEARKMIDQLSYSKQVTVMLAALCHDFGKATTTEIIDGRIRAFGHDLAGVEPTQTFLNRLGIFTFGGFDVRAQVLALVRNHLMPAMFYKQPPSNGAFRRLAKKVELDLLYRVSKADSLGRNPDWLPLKKWSNSDAQEWFIERVHELNLERKPPEAILLGRHLIEAGMPPSKQFGEILKEIYELQLDEKIVNLDDALAAAQRLWKKSEGGE